VDLPGEERGDHQRARQPHRQRATRPTAPTARLDDGASVASLGFQDADHFARGYPQRQERPRGPPQARPARYHAWATCPGPPLDDAFVGSICGTPVDPGPRQTTRGWGET
jgi:hypothetical protein